MKKAEREEDFKDWNGKTFVDFQGLQLQSADVGGLFKKIVDGAGSIPLRKP